MWVEWWPGTELNCRHYDFQSYALPTELPGRRSRETARGSSQLYQTTLMDATSREVLWGQFGGAIDMLENAIRACPDALWGDRDCKPEFWYLAYHTLFFLDLYLHDAVDGFAPPAPFTLDELDPSGKCPIVSTRKRIALLSPARQTPRAHAYRGAQCRDGYQAVSLRLEGCHPPGVAAVEHASRAAPCGAVEPAASTGDRFSSQVGGDEPIGAARRVVTNGHKQTQRITLKASAVSQLCEKSGCTRSVADRWRCSAALYF